MQFKDQESVRDGTSPGISLGLVKTDCIRTWERWKKLLILLLVTPWYLPMRHQQWGVLCIYLLCWGLSWSFSYGSLSSNFKSGILFHCCWPHIKITPRSPLWSNNQSQSPVFEYPLLEHMNPHFRPICRWYCCCWSQHMPAKQNPRRSQGCECSWNHYQ